MLVLNCFPFQQLVNFSSLLQFLHINEHDMPISPSRAYSHQRRAVFFLLRKFCCGFIKAPYISMGHLDEQRFSVGELHAASKTSSANGSHLNVWGFDISAAEKKRASLVWIGPLQFQALLKTFKTYSHYSAFSLLILHSMLITITGSVQ